MVLSIYIEQNESDILNSDVLNAHPVHKEVVHICMAGGVQDGTSNTYLKYYSHFIKIIIALGHDPFVIPVARDLILLYLANGLLQPKPNVYDTCRYKMRALDWVNQNCGYKTSWSDDGFIVPIMNFIKQYYPSLGSKLIPL